MLPSKQACGSLACLPSSSQGLFRRPSAPEATAAEAPCRQSPCCLCECKHASTAPWRAALSHLNLSPQALQAALKSLSSMFMWWVSRCTNTLSLLMSFTSSMACKVVAFNLMPLGQSGGRVFRMKCRFAHDQSKKQQEHVSELRAKVCMIEEWGRCGPVRLCCRCWSHIG